MAQIAKRPLKIVMAAPRGFCAGVVRAIDIVELALRKYGAPVYVRHEIVHNRYVVEDLETKGAVFIEELGEIPDQDHDRPVIFSAHGVPKSVPEEARKRNLFFLDATCPLVSKVHMEAERLFGRGFHILLIGHAGHPEVVGTMGQLPEGTITLIETVEEARTVVPPSPERLAYTTQTTLSVDDTLEIVETLQGRFPGIEGPAKSDICYATTNRQQAVKVIAPQCDMLIVVGAPNSSNSQRLVEVARKNGCTNSMLVQRAAEIQWERIGSIATLGIAAGASAPEVLVEEVVKAFQARYDVTLDTVTTKKESVSFKLPRELRQVAAE